MEVFGLFRDCFSEHVYFPHKLLHAVSLQDVVESGNHQNINPSRFLAILNPEGLLEGFNLCPWNGDIVRVLDIPLVLVTAQRTARWGPEHVEGGTGHAEFDSLSWVQAMGKPA